MAIKIRPHYTQDLTFQNNPLASKSFDPDWLRGLHAWPKTVDDAQAITESIIDEHKNLAPTEGVGKMEAYTITVTRIVGATKVDIEDEDVVDLTMSGWDLTILTPLKLVTKGKGMASEEVKQVQATDESDETVFE